VVVVVVDELLPSPVSCENDAVDIALIKRNIIHAFMALNRANRFMVFVFKLNEWVRNNWFK